MGKKIIVKKAKKVKPRNANTMTESAFWSFIRAALRQRSRFWKPILLTKLQARRPYTGPNKRQKFEYLCNNCKNWFPEKSISVDHIDPVGILNCAADLPGFVERLFCEKEGLHCLCDDCHTAKTKLENSSRIKIEKL